jgi:putative oxygen-independent coproporphyrinogen III oxidase
LAGIYVHIPYCRKACTYCDFHFSTLLGNKSDLLHAIMMEIELRSGYLRGEKIESIYFGGGTPSVMTHSETQTFIGLIRRNFEVDDKAEITLEANPDDLSPENLGKLREAGINRLSIGIQSFDDEVLGWMNRSHNAKQAIESVKHAQQLGFENVTVDLIYGIPGKDERYWRDQLQQLLELNVPHVSGYALTVEKETVLDNWIRKGRASAPDEDMSHRQFMLGSEVLTSAGYEHYELSNFARPGYRAVHNSAYWKSRPYLGVGPSAHSFDGDSRQWNVSNNRLYLSAIESGEINFEREDLSVADRLNERIMTALRTMEGLDLKSLARDFGVDLQQHVMNEAHDLFQKGSLLMEEDRIVIPREQWFYSDGIAASLFYI